MDLNKIDLSCFTGTQTVFRHSVMRNVLYSEGAQHVAEHGGAYWLLDKIACSQLVRKLRSEPFQAWKLTVTDSVGILICTDGNDNVLLSEHITFTDFPLDEVELWVEGNVILLPSEH